MSARPLLLAALLCLKLPAVLAQNLPVRSYLPGYEVSKLARPALALLPGLPATPPAASIPTVRAATAYPPLTAPAQRFDQPLPTAALSPAPPYDLTGPRAAPPYDLYQNWPEAQRKATLPALYAEPLPLQLLRGVLGR